MRRETLQVVSLTFQVPLFLSFDFPGIYRELYVAQKSISIAAG